MHFTPATIALRTPRHKTILLATTASLTHSFGTILLATRASLTHSFGTIPEPHLLTPRHNSTCNHSLTHSLLRHNSTCDHSLTYSLSGTILLATRTSLTHSAAQFYLRPQPHSLTPLRYNSTCDQSLTHSLTPRHNSTCDQSLTHSLLFGTILLATTASLTHSAAQFYL